MELKSKKRVTNMKAFLTALLIIGLIEIGNITFAQDQEADQKTTLEISHKNTDMGINHEYKGFVNTTENGYTLSDGEDVYMLQGENLEELIGQKVLISGELLEGETMDTIIVDIAEVIE
ncbi:hypothetical protein [Desulfobacula phenolica]|uniref:Uncharacterized protein n=1 Tax=Desulfobacula phenolica TaxID=90732 RepID=A0A1H2DME3_9BACT|nr:hypothetical protein [Desulfobacula phenolica]SDT83914.1 hypothetical protein SAMN04487931_10159 [Desulfobacula phenolica]